MARRHVGAEPSSAAGGEVSRGSRRRPAALAAAATMLVAAVGALLLSLTLERRTAREQRQAEDLGAATGREVESRIGRLLAATDTMAGLFARAGTADFAGLAEDLRRRLPEVGAVLLLRRGAVEAAAPPEAEQRAVDLSTVAAGAGPTLAGPLRLPESRRLSFFAVVPVAGDESLAVVAAVDVDELGRAAGLERLPRNGFDYQLAHRGDDGRTRVFARSTELELERPVRHDLDLQAGRWDLAVAPRDGWTSWSTKRTEALVVGLFALLAGLAAYDLARRPERLRRQVAQRSRRLEEERRQRLLSEAREAWQGLDRFSRLALVAVRHAGTEPPPSEESVCHAVAEALEDADLDFGSEEILAGVSRLLDLGVLSRDDAGRLRIEQRSLLELPATSKPLVEVARDSQVQVGSFRLQRRLGGGGMGEVFRAVDTRTETPAAIKLLYPQALGDPEMRQRFEREGAIVAGLEHPNIVRFLDRGENLGQLYIAMELVDGEPLNRVIARGPTPTPAAVGMLFDLARALAELHRRGLVHRDIKASNVIRKPDGRCVLLDFGLASGPTSHTLTATDAIIGTLPYLAPERLRGMKATSSADVWAVGVLFYELLFGCLPWQDTTHYALVAEVLSTRSGFSARAAEAVGGPILGELSARLLEPDPVDRLASGVELVEYLEDRPELAAMETAARHAAAAPPEAPTGDSQATEVSTYTLERRESQKDRG